MAEREGMFKRGKYWHVRTDPIERRQLSTGKQTKAAAIRWIEQRRIEAERIATDPAYAAQGAQAKEQFQIFLARCKKRGLAKATLGMYAQKLGHWLRVFGEDSTMRDINRPNMDRFHAQRLDEGAHPHTISKEVAILTRSLKLSIRAGVWFGDLATLAPPDLKPEYVPRERALPLEEVAALVPCIENKKLLALAAVCIALGIRRSEARKLTREDVDMEAGFARIRGTKTKGADRVVPVFSIFRELLELALPMLPIGAQNNIYRDLEVACRRAGIDKATPNDFRRSNATILLEHEVSPEVVRRVLGHTTEAMLRRIYGRTRPQALKDMGERAIARRAFVASPTIRDGFAPCESSLSDCNCVGEAPQNVTVRLPKPKVGSSNLPGGASLLLFRPLPRLLRNGFPELSRQCRVTPRQALALVAGELGLLGQAVAS